MMFQLENNFHASSSPSKSLVQRWAFHIHCTISHLELEKPLFLYTTNKSWYNQLKNCLLVDTILYSRLKWLPWWIVVWAAVRAKLRPSGTCKTKKSGAISSRHCLYTHDIPELIRHLKLGLGPDWDLNVYKQINPKNKAICLVFRQNRLKTFKTK